MSPSAVAPWSTLLTSVNSLLADDHGGGIMQASIWWAWTAPCMTRSWTSSSTWALRLPVSRCADPCMQVSSPVTCRGWPIQTLWAGAGSSRLWHNLRGLLHADSWAVVLACMRVLSQGVSQLSLACCFVLLHALSGSCSLAPAATTAGPQKAPTPQRCTRAGAFGL